MHRLQIAPIHQRGLTPRRTALSPIPGRLGTDVTPRLPHCSHATPEAHPTNTGTTLSSPSKLTSATFHGMEMPDDFAQTDLRSMHSTPASIHPHPKHPSSDTRCA